MISLKRAASEWGWFLGVAGLLVGILALVIAVRVNAPLARDATGAQLTRVVPATGIEGFNTSFFCNEDLTKVKPKLIPDVGISYELLRVKDGVAESVTIIIALDSKVLVSTHYYDTTQGQQSEPAVVDKATLDCLARKAK